MVIRDLVVIGAVGLSLAACKFPSLTPAEKAGPPPLPAAPSLKAAASSPAPVSTAQAAPPCACAETAKAPQSIYSAAPAAAAGHAGPAPSRRAAAAPHRQLASANARRTRSAGHGAASSGSRHETRGARDHSRTDETHAGSGYVNAAAAGDTGRAYAASSQSYESTRYESTRYEEQSYESRQFAGGPQYQEGYVEGFSHGPYAQGGGYSATRDYIVRRSVRGDVERSRAWTRVR